MKNTGYGTSKQVEVVGAAYFLLIATGNDKLWRQPLRTAAALRQPAYDDSAIRLCFAAFPSEAFVTEA